MLYWIHEKNGIYTVKSGYKAIWNQKFSQEHTRYPSSVDLDFGLRQHSNFWKLLWKLPLPPRLKIFMWRVCRDIVPTRSRLLQRGINIVNGCCLCNAETENLNHLLIECKLIKDVLSELNFDPFDQLQVQDNWLRTVIAIFSRLNGEQQQIIAFLWDEIWYVRNQYLHNNSTIPYATVVAAAVQNKVHRFKDAVGRQEQASSNSTQQKWKKPVVTEFKINVDAALFQGCQAAGIGIVIRDRNGNFVAARNLLVADVTEPLTAELIAAKEGLKFGHELGLRKVFLESDSSIVIASLKIKSNDRSYNGNILFDIYDLASRFYYFECGYTNRNCNNVADILANHASSLECDSWLDIPPTFILNALCKDVLS